MENQPLTFTNFDNSFVPELNTWQQKENSLGYDGLNEFVVSKGSGLGDYLQFVSEEMPDVPCLLAFDQKDLVGFVSYSTPEPTHTHIEIMGVNPDFRGQGMSSRLLLDFKQLMQEQTGMQTLTLDVNKKNTSGKKAFAKIGTLAPEQKKDNYITYNL